MNRNVIANWKMHFNLRNAVELCTLLGEIENCSNLIIAAPTLYLAHLTYLFPNLAFAAQDVSTHAAYGAHTGEVSATQLASCGVRYCIVGHPERRRDFGEDDEIVKRKADNCFAAGLVPIICLGSNLLLAKEFGSNCMIAYEPEGSIGTGVVQDNKRLGEVFGELKSMVAKSVNLVYGGSVNSGNLAAIKSVQEIDSVFLGGASLKADELEKILKNW